MASLATKDSRILAVKIYFPHKKMGSKSSTGSPAKICFSCMRPTFLRVATNTNLATNQSNLNERYVVLVFPKLNTELTRSCMQDSYIRYNL